MDSEDAAWAALIARRDWPGVYAVASTGIYCRFGCPSRPPRRENLRLFNAALAAEAAGFRACKRCGGGDVARVRHASP